MTAPHSQAEIERALGRYRPLVSDWQAFCDALLRPHIRCMWAHPQRPAGARVTALLGEDGIESEPIEWAPGAFRLPSVRHPGRHWSYRAGLYQVQEEASMLPVFLLAPKPGERVLDMCAAPGNKSAQIALAMANRGTVVANDRDPGRLRAIQNLIDRLGLLNVSVTEHNGISYPLSAGPFDRVLVDAPCSAEGTARKQAALRSISPGFRRWVTGIQRDLLRRAVTLTRPGGRIVYSTCTFAPEENELVVDAILSEYADALVLRQARIDGLAAEPGLTSWQGRRLRPELAGAVRLWPHVSNTGGFFAAVLERTEATLATSSHAKPTTMDSLSVGSRPLGRYRSEPGWQPALDEPKVRAVCERHGLPEALFASLNVARMGRYLRLRASDHRPPRGLSLRTSGLPAIPKKPRQPRLSTYGTLAFGHAATQNVLTLTRAELAGFHAGEATPLALDRLARCTEGGYVLARVDPEVALGLGLLRIDPDRARLESRYPKAWIDDK